MLGGKGRVGSMRVERRERNYAGSKIEMVKRVEGVGKRR